MRECKASNKYDAAASVQRVLELLKDTGVATTAASGETFLQTTADEISKRARRRVQLMKERQYLQKIVEFVSTHNDTLRRKHAAFVTVKNVYTNEKMQRGDSRKKRRN